MSALHGSPLGTELSSSLVQLKLWFVCKFDLGDIGCVHTAGKSDSNRIHSQIQYLGLIDHTDFEKLPKGCVL